MNQQEAFNQVVSNMRDQGKPCYGKFSNLAFENKANNTRCAIGSMLSSETLQMIEDEDISEVAEILEEDIDELDISDLTHIQQCLFWENMAEIHDDTFIDLLPDDSNWMQECEIKWGTYAAEAGLTLTAQESK